MTSSGLKAAPDGPGRSPRALPSPGHPEAEWAPPSRPRPADPPPTFPASQRALAAPKSILTTVPPRTRSAPVAASTLTNPLPSAERERPWHRNPGPRSPAPACAQNSAGPTWLVPPLPRQREGEGRGGRVGRGWGRGHPEGKGKGRPQNRRGGSGTAAEPGGWRRGRRERGGGERRRRSWRGGATVTNLMRIPGRRRKPVELNATVGCVVAMRSPLPGSRRIPVPVGLHDVRPSVARLLTSLRETEVFPRTSAPLGPG